MSTYNEREFGLAIAMLKHAGPSLMSEVNFDKVAADTGYKDAQNARTCCGRFVKKLMGSTDSSASPVIQKSNKRKATDDTPTKTNNTDNGETPAKKRGRPSAKNKKAKGENESKSEHKDGSKEDAMIKEDPAGADGEGEEGAAGDSEGQGGNDTTLAV